MTTMKRKDLTPEVIQATIKEYYEKTSGYVSRLVKVIGNGAMAIPRTPRKMGNFQFDYFFAADLDMLARFALGGVQASRKFVLELCDNVEETLFLTPAGVRAPIPAEFHDTSLGFMVALARARCALRLADGPNLTAVDVRRLSGESDKYLKKSGLLKKDGDTPEEFAAFLEANGHPV